MNSQRISAFTLLELMIVITIIGIISVASYMPYAHHQKKVLVKQAARELSQSFSEARNLAINGLLSGSGNVNTALRFASGATKLEYYIYTEALSANYDATFMKIMKEKDLPKWVQVKSVNTMPQDFFVSYEAILWASQNSLSTSWAIDIVLAYKNTGSPVLQQTVSYYPASFISDY